MQLGKNKAITRGKKLTNPSLFPVVLQSDELSWKLWLAAYDFEEETFLLCINNVPFLELQY